jgi:hypothetical protein
MEIAMSIQTVLSRNEALAAISKRADAGAISTEERTEETRQLFAWIRHPSEMVVSS